MGISRVAIICKIAFDKQPTRKMVSRKLSDESQIWEKFLGEGEALNYQQLSIAKTEASNPFDAPLSDEFLTTTPPFIIFLVDLFLT